VVAADRIHSAAIHLLTRTREVDAESGITPARLSALAALTYAGPQTLGELARLEGVRSPTMTRIVHGLEGAGLASRRRSDDDARTTQIVATRAGRRLVENARSRRLAFIAKALSPLPTRDLAELARLASEMESVLGFGSRSRAHHRRHGSGDRARDATSLQIL
jgi:DNA-binding MarR family transcriptional regulator